MASRTTKEHLGKDQEKLVDIGGIPLKDMAVGLLPGAVSGT